jgi:hypothetical protein
VLHRCKCSRSFASTLRATGPDERCLRPSFTRIRGKQRNTMLNWVAAALARLHHLLLRRDLRHLAQAFDAAEHRHQRLGRVTTSIDLPVAYRRHLAVADRARRQLPLRRQRQGRDCVIFEARPTPRPNRAPILKPHRPPGWCSHQCEIARATTLRSPARAGPIRRSRRLRSGSDC